MKIKILGSAAYERVPAMFCKCPICTYAREHGGKDIRTQAQTLINEDLLIDFGEDNYIHSLQPGVDFTKVQHLLLTHAHSDHFMPNELAQTRPPYGHNDMELIKVYGGQACMKKYQSSDESDKSEFVPVEPYAPFTVGDYTVTALPARHGTEDPYVYVISDGSKTVFYDHDSGISFDEVYDYIEKQKLHFDMVIGDCTNAHLHFDRLHGHKSLIDNQNHRQRLAAMGAVDEKTVWVVTHFSHNGLVVDGKAVPHEVFSQQVAEKGMICGYDGIEFEI